MDKTGQQAYDLIESQSENSKQFSSRGKRGVGSKGVYELGIGGDVQSQMAAFDRKLDMIVKAMSNQSLSRSASLQNAQVCAICSYSDHTTDCCPMSSVSEHEQVNYMQQRPKYDPYSNTYNPGWKDHPNFKWSNNNAHLAPPGFQQGPRPQALLQYNPPQPAHAPTQQTQGKSLEELVTSMASTTNTFMQETKAYMQKTDKSIQNLERQMSQMATALAQTEQGKLPSTTTPNPKGAQNAEVNAITLRSGKQLTEQPNVPREIRKKEEEIGEQDEEPETEEIISDPAMPKESKNKKTNSSDLNLSRVTPITSTSNISCVPFPRKVCKF
jgi:hypothetical protein